MVSRCHKSCKTRLLILASIVLLTGFAAAACGTAPKEEVRKWRIVVNDDGDFVPPGNDADLEKYLDVKFRATVNTQVDAYFFCIGSTDRVWDPQRARAQDAMSQWAKYGDVPEHVDRMIKKYIGAARGAGMQIFMAVRLNDIHDAWAATLTYPLKVQRPDLLIGKKGAGGGHLMNAHWSGLDWAHSEVRDHFLQFIAWAAARWDFDGVELDWFRHPLFFKPGEEQANILNINQFVRDARGGLDKVGRQRGRAYLLTARVPDSPRLALNTGLDVEQWLTEGLLDMLMVGGGYMPYGGRVKQFIDMAHRYGIHAYPCKNHFDDPQFLRSVAANFWSLGADGFYQFNYTFNDQATWGDDVKTAIKETLSEVGSPQTLARLDKRFVADTGANVHYIGHTNPQSQFPVRLVGGRPVELVVGDDLAAQKRVKATLVIKVGDLEEGASITVRVNGRQVAQNRVVRTAADTFTIDVQPAFFAHGINQIHVLHGPGSSGHMKAAVNALEVLVDYDP